ncbi:MAG TPA: hypothetical protein VGE08_17500 [Steroidobacter sp.]|uniref:hypothetical protein n=1 Tax=Steroidobacter sp. TaxID=1978227 RepID=UPI002ED9D068
MAKGQAVASLLVSIGADVSGLQQGGRQGAKAMDDLGRHAKELSTKMAALGAAAAAAGAAVVAGLVKSGMENIDTQAKLARSLGSTIDGLRALQLASGEAGVQQQELSGAMKQLNARLGEAQRGTGEARKALDILGLSAQSLAQMDTDARMAAVADRVRELGLSTSQTGDLLRKMGIESLSMVDFMRQGGDAIRKARDDVKAFGLGLSEVDGAKIEATRDALARVGLTMESIRNHLALAFAPMLKELADRFNELAKENNGFGRAAVDAVEKALVPVGWLADGLHGLHVILKGLQLVAEGFGSAFYTVLEGIVVAVSTMSDAIASDINKSIQFFNNFGASIAEIPLMGESQWVQDFRNFAFESRERVANLRSGLHDLAMQEMPSEKIRKFAEEARTALDEVAKATVAARPGGGSFESEDEGDSKYAEQQAKLLEAQREALAQRLNAIIEFAATEDELEIARHEQKLEDLRYALEEELLLEEEYHILKQELEDRHQEEMKKIREKGMTAMERFTAMSFANQAKTVAAGLADMTAALARDSRTMFEINKVAGIANATVAMFQGIAEGLKLGWPMAIPAVAYATATGAAAIAGIKKQSFGSGAAPSVAGTAPATPVTPVTGGGASVSAQPSQVIAIEGMGADQLFSGRAVRELIERLEDAHRDGAARVVFA